MFILATVSCTLVVLSLVHFLMALAANYAHIRGHDKFTDLAVNIIFYSEILLRSVGKKKFCEWFPFVNIIEKDTGVQKQFCLFLKL